MKEARRRWPRAEAIGRVTKPYKARADFAGAEAVLTSLSSLQMQKIVSNAVSNDAKDLGQVRTRQAGRHRHGDTPEARARRWRLGKKEGDIVLRTRRVAADRLHDSGHDRGGSREGCRATLRRKDMFDGRSFNTTRVELKRGGETLTFDKSKGKDGKDVWKNAAGKDVDTAKVEDMLTKLSNIRAQLFQERVDPGLKMPTLVATLKLDNNMTETVTFARNGNAVLANRERRTRKRNRRSDGVQRRDDGNRRGEMSASL